jgi:hypothetical protein
MSEEMQQQLEAVLANLQELKVGTWDLVAYQKVGSKAPSFQNGFS